MRWSTSLWRGSALLLLSGLATRAQNSSEVFTPPPDTAGTQATAQSILNTPSRTPNMQYSNLLGNLLWFYEAQRSGVLPADNRVPWRNNSLTDDGEQLSHVDLSGGYYDAGNFIKATFPLSWTQQSIAWGASVYGLSYELTNQAQYLDSMLRWGFDWMLKASNTPDTLWVQVATAAGDTYWGGDQNIPSPRQAFQVNRTSPGTDAFAAAAAAFAAGSFLYSGGVLPANASSPGISTNSTPLASIKNATYASTLMQRAVSMWDLATTSTPMQVYQTVVPQVKDAYPSTDFFDDLTLAGLWLAIATGNKTYSDAATAFYGQMLTSRNTPNANGQLGGPLNWDQKSPATALLFVQAAKFNPQLGINATRFQTDMDTYLESLTSLKLGKVFLTPATQNSSGLLWYPGDSDAASLNPALNAAFLLHTFSGFSSDPSMSAKYQRFGDAQFDYILGANPMNAVYIVGQHPNSAQNPHSALASGGDDIGEIDTVPPTEAHVLYGGVVGGPDKQNNYYDQRSDYTQTEIALDYNAPVLSLTAARIQYQAWTAPPLESANAAPGGALGDPVYVALEPGTRVQPPRDAERQDVGGLSISGRLGIGISVGIVFLFACAASGWFFGNKMV